jgi:hypothetical protein
MIEEQLPLLAHNLPPLALRDRFGHDALFLEFAERRGVWAAWMNDRLIYDEHAADALGLALACAPRVQVVG